jgi:hypothetical protein
MLLQLIHQVLKITGPEPILKKNLVIMLGTMLTAMEKPILLNRRMPMVGDCLI